MKYLSVCSGIEAASVAWRPLGWFASAFSEIEKFPNAVLDHHYPETPNLGDMTCYADWPDLRPDVLVGGTPCQSFSVAGLRQGLADPRGNLALVFLGLVDRYRPRWVVWENVPGVLSSSGGRDFGAFLGGLGQLGYGWAYRSLDAQYFGLAQRRQRVFVVAHSGGWTAPAAVLLERESLCGHPAPRREAGEGTTDRAIPSLTASGRGVERTEESRGQDPVVIMSHDPACTLTAREYKGPLPEADLSTVVTHSLRADGFDASEDGTGRGTPLVPMVAPCLTQNYGKQPDSSDTSAGPMLIPIDMRQASRGATMTNNRAEGTSGGAPGTGIGEVGDPSPSISTSHPPAVAFAIQERAVSTGSSGPDGIGCREELAYTLEARNKVQAVSMRGREGGATAELSDVPSALRASKGGGDKAHVLNAMQVRRLTPRECERLQGFPDDYTLVPFRGKPAADGPRYKALGNSMAVPVIRWIGERITLVESGR